MKVDTQYPALFLIADKSTISSQKSYLILIKLEFSVLIFAAIFSNINSGIPFLMKVFNYIVPVLLFIALITRILVELIGFDKKWFNARAIAESVKSLSWRYMSKAEPYQGDPHSEEVDKKFLKDIIEIRNNRLEGAGKLSKHVISGKEITENMRHIRKNNLEDRKSYYNENRVNDQKNWYVEKAQLNENRKVFWFWGSLIIEGIAVILSFFSITLPSAQINPVGILITIVAVIVAWTQIKKYRELSQSYCLVVQDLGQISSIFIHIDNEEKLSDYVNETEGIISKEHSLWSAKRDY